MQPILHLNDASDEISLRLASWSQRYLCLKVWTQHERTPARVPYYKLTLSLRLWWANKGTDQTEGRLVCPFDVHTSWRQVFIPWVPNILKKSQHLNVKWWESRKLKPTHDARNLFNTLWFIKIISFVSTDDLWKHIMINAQKSEM